MTDRLIQRHDQFAKHLLDQPGAADSFLRERLPAPVAARLSAAPAVDRSESFIDPVLAEHRGDRVFALQMGDGEEVLVWALLEHKSGPEPDSLVQTLGNLAGIACKGAKPRRNPDGTVWMAPAAVFPIIVYHGTRRWPLPLDLGRAYPLPTDVVGGGLLSFTYTLVNLAEIPDDRLSANPALQAGLLVLKYSLKDESPEVTLERLIAASAVLGLASVAMVVRYLAIESDWLSYERLRSVVARLLPGKEEEMLTSFRSPLAREIIEEAAPRILAEGMAKGRAEGRAEILLRQFRRKFGELPAGVADRIRTAGIDALDEWSERILDAETLEEVFAKEPPGRAP